MEAIQVTTYVNTAEYIKNITEMGGDDYRRGKYECDNPFHIRLFPEEHRMWAEGYHRERQRFEPDTSAALRVGDAVEWTAKIRGKEYKHRGKVAGVIPPGRDFIVVAAVQLDLYGRHNCKEQYPEGRPRDHDSYAVLVWTPKATQKNKLYWPRVSQLRKVNK